MKYLFLLLLFVSSAVAQQDISGRDGRFSRNVTGLTYNKLTLTQPATSAVLTILNGKTLTVNNTLTLSGTDSSTLNIGAGGTLGTAAFTNATAYQPVDSDLTSWALITRASGFDTFTATPSGANLASLLTTALPLTKGGTGATTATGAWDALNVAETTVASATTTDIGAVASNHVSITGTTTITGFGTIAAGATRWGRFTGALTLTYNASSLILPGAASITTAAGDSFMGVSLGSGNWVVYNYVKADGSPLKLNALYGSDGTTRLNVPYTVYAAGTAYSLTTTPAALDFGTTDPAIVVAAPGTYMVTARVNLRYNAATFAAEQNATIKLRRTNNTAADIANMSTAIQTRIVTAATGTLATTTMSGIYTTTNSNDSLTIFGDIAVAPGAGSLDTIEASIVLVRLYE